MDFIAQGIEFFRHGGIVMYFLLAASIFVVFIGIERTFYFSRRDGHLRMPLCWMSLMQSSKMLLR